MKHGLPPVFVSLVLLAGCAADERAARRAKLPAYEHRLVLQEPPEFDSTARERFVMRPIEPERPFTEALLSWNIQAPAGAGGRVEARARGLDGHWSDWLLVGVFGDARAPDDARREDGHVRIDVDYLVADASMDALQYRVASDEAVDVERIAVCFTSIDPARTNDDIDIRPTAARIDIDVPFRNQFTDRPDLAGRLCSPASTAMVMAYRGVDEAVGAVAETAHDPDFDLYGNWPRNIQAAYEMGVPGYVTRFDDWRDVERLLAQGQPIIASFRSKKGELRNAPYDSTGGHLIVLRGLDARGDLLVSDAAVSDAEQGELTYKRADLTRVWLGRGKGTAYVLLPTDEHDG